MGGKRLVNLPYVRSFVRLAKQGIWLCRWRSFSTPEIVTFANERMNKPSPFKGYFAALTGSGVLHIELSEKNGIHTLFLVSFISVP